MNNNLGKTIIFYYFIFMDYEKWTNSKWPLIIFTLYNCDKLTIGICLKGQFIWNSVNPVFFYLIGQSFDIDKHLLLLLH